MLFKHMSLFICTRQNILKLNLGIPPLTELSFELNSMLRSISISMSPVYQCFGHEHQCSIQQRTSKPYWKALLEFIFDFSRWCGFRTLTTNSNHQGWSCHRLRSSHQLIFIISIPRCSINGSGSSCKLK